MKLYLYKILLASDHRLQDTAEQFSCMFPIYNQQYTS